MPRRSKAVVSKTVIGKDAQAVFNEALGSDKPPDPSIVWPKFKRLRTCVLRFVKLVAWLGERSWIEDGFAAEAASIRAFADGLYKEFVEAFGSAPDLDARSLELSKVMREVFDSLDAKGRDDFNQGVEMASPGDISRFLSMYKESIECDLVNTAVATCDSLSQYKSYLDDSENLSGRFLLTPGFTFDPIPGLPAANFKAFYSCASTSASERTTLLLFLHRLYKHTHDVYDVSSEPDIDVEVMVESIVGSLGEVKKRIPRCEEAFKCLEDSVGLLRSNFTKYTRDSKNSGNPALLMENFVMDVANGSGKKANLRVRQQLKTIISFYRKQMAGRPKQPGTDVLFKEINKNFKWLDDSTGGEGAEGAPEDTPDEAAAGESDEMKIAAEAEAQLGATEAAKAAAAGKREMTDEEKASHKAEMSKIRKKRAAAKKKAKESINRYLAQDYTPSALCLSLQSPPAESGALPPDEGGDCAG